MEQPEATAPERDAYEHRAFIVGRLRGSTPKSIVVSELIGRGLERKWAEEIVDQFEADAAELDAQEKMTAPALLLAGIAALLVAVIAGFLWGLVAAKLDRQLSALACGVGVLCGGAVVFASGRRKGIPLQVIAAVATVLGILIAKYCAVYYVVTAMIAEEVGVDVAAVVPLFSGVMVRIFLDNILAVMSIFDSLYIPGAIVLALAIPLRAGIKPTQPGAAL
jgi:hypothetical protein